MRETFNGLYLLDNNKPMVVHYKPSLKGTFNGQAIAWKTQKNNSRDTPLYYWAKTSRLASLLLFISLLWKEHAMVKLSLETKRTSRYVFMRMDKYKQFCMTIVVPQYPSLKETFNGQAIAWKYKQLAQEIPLYTSEQKQAIL